MDRIDALLPSKPFWGVSVDPNTLLVLQELSLDILSNMVVEKSRSVQCTPLLPIPPHVSAVPNAAAL